MFNLGFIQYLKKILFPFYKRNDLRFVFNKLQEGHSREQPVAMFVGGCVRKYISKEDIDDIDAATILKTDQIKQKFENTKIQVIDSGVEHGTVTLISKNFKMELTTLRKDIKTDGRHAEIEFTDNWQEDSNRRDFTINAIYLDIKGKVFDPQLGTTDLKNKNIKFIGDPQKRIEEDYLRIIRYIRFSLQYESKSEVSVIDAIKINLGGIKKISKERVLIELFKILRLKNFSNICKDKSLKEIFSMIFPEFKYFERLNRLNEIFQKSIIPKIIIENFLNILLIDDNNNHEYFIHKYNVSNKLRENLALIANNFTESKQDKNFFQKNLKKNIYYYGKEHLKIINLINFSNDKKIKFDFYQNTMNKIEKVSIPKFPYDGKYLINKGLKEGKLIGKILKLIEDEWLINDFSISKERILKIIDSQKN